MLLICPSHLTYFICSFTLLSPSANQNFLELALPNASASWLFPKRRAFRKSCRRDSFASLARACDNSHRGVSGKFAAKRSCADAGSTSVDPPWSCCLNMEDERYESSSKEIMRSLQCIPKVYKQSVCGKYHARISRVITHCCSFVSVQQINTPGTSGIPSTHCTTTLGDFYNHNTIRSLSHACLQMRTVQYHPKSPLPLPTLFTLAFLIGWKLIKWKRNASVSRKHHSELVSWTCETEPTSTIRCGSLPVSEAAPWGSFTWR